MVSFFLNDTATTEIYTTDTLFPYTTLFRSHRFPASGGRGMDLLGLSDERLAARRGVPDRSPAAQSRRRRPADRRAGRQGFTRAGKGERPCPDLGGTVVTCFDDIFLTSRKREGPGGGRRAGGRSEEHTSTLQSPM